MLLSMRSASVRACQIRGAGAMAGLGRRWSTTGGATPAPGTRGKLPHGVVVPVAVASGDGIGPEIMASVTSIFEAARVPIEFRHVQMGKKVYLNGHSTGMTPEATRTIEELGVLFKGPMETPKGSGVKSINVTARKTWNTFANKRVFETLPGVDTIFSAAHIPVHLTLFRENIEELYGAIEHQVTNDVAQCRRLITRPGTMQLMELAFENAYRRQARRITCAHKANIMKVKARPAAAAAAAAAATAINGDVL